MSVLDLKGKFAKVKKWNIILHEFSLENKR